MLTCNEFNIIFKWINKYILSVSILALNTLNLNRKKHVNQSSLGLQWFEVVPRPKCLRIGTFRHELPQGVYSVNVEHMK